MDTVDISEEYKMHFTAGSVIAGEILSLIIVQYIYLVTNVYRSVELQ